MNLSIKDYKLLFKKGLTEDEETYSLYTGYICPRMLLCDGDLIVSKLEGRKERSMLFVLRLSFLVIGISRVVKFQVHRFHLITKLKKFRVVERRSQTLLFKFCLSLTTLLVNS